MAQAADCLFRAQRLDYPLRTGSKDPFVLSFAQYFALLAILPNRDTDDVGLIEVPNSPFMEFVAGGAEFLKIRRLNFIHRAFVRAPTKYFVLLVCAELEFGEDRIGRIAGSISRSRFEDIPSRWRRQSIRWQIHCWHNVLHELRNLHPTQGYEQV